MLDETPYITRIASGDFVGAEMVARAMLADCTSGAERAFVLSLQGHALQLLGRPVAALDVFCLAEEAQPTKAAALEVARAMLLAGNPPADVREKVERVLQGQEELAGLAWHTAHLLLAEVSLAVGDSTGFGKHLVGSIEGCSPDASMSLGPDLGVVSRFVTRGVTHSAIAEYLALAVAWIERRGPADRLSEALQQLEKTRRVVGPGSET